MGTMKKKQLRKMYEFVCNEYVQKFCDKQELTNEGWVGNHVGETAVCSDFYFNLTDIVFDIDSNQPKWRILDWYGNSFQMKMVIHSQPTKLYKNVKKTTQKLDE